MSKKLNRRALPLPPAEMDIVGLSHDGRGVARNDGKATFVIGAIPGEKVMASVIGLHRRYDEARVTEVLQASKDRVVPRCPHFTVCAGCSLQHMEPSAQIQAKQQILLDNLSRIGQVQPEQVLPPLVAEIWNYRRRARLSAKFVEKKGRLLLGFREIDGRFVADISQCDILHPKIANQFSALHALVASLSVVREVPQVEASIGDNKGALLFRHLSPLSTDDVAALRQFHTDSGFDIHVQAAGPESVMLLCGDGEPLSFAIPNHNIEMQFLISDFVQINQSLNLLMIDKALQLLDLSANDKVLDLFCGLGNFTLPMARYAKSVVGVEGEASLVQRAIDNAKRNGLLNVNYHQADLFLDDGNPEWAATQYDKILLDPPRAGAAEVLEYLPTQNTQRLVYVSCHPGSLARDAGTLVRKHGFKLRSVGVMDMFAHTAHVESIALFERD